MIQLSRRSFMATAGLASVAFAAPVTLAHADADHPQASDLAKLEATFYQPVVALDGFATDVYINLINPSANAIRLHTEAHFTVRVITVAGPNVPRPLTRNLSSFGKFVFVKRELVDGQAADILQWTLPSGTNFDSEQGKTCREVDCVLGIGDGLVFTPRRGRVKVRVEIEGNGVYGDSQQATRTPFGRTNGLF